MHDVLVEPLDTYMFYIITYGLKTGVCNLDIHYFHSSL